MSPKDLLDFDKMNTLKKSVKQMRKVAMKETLKQEKKKTYLQDNFKDLNQLNQENE